MSCEIQKSLTLRSPPSCTSNNIDHVAESSRERLCLKKPFFISLFSAKINSHQPPRKMAFVVGLHSFGTFAWSNIFCPNSNGIDLLIGYYIISNELHHYAYFISVS